MFTTLVYHIVNKRIDSKISISENVFKKQLELLLDRYRILTLSDAINTIYKKENSTDQSILITFDDGYTDNVQIALPILCDLKIPASLFIITKYIGQLNRWNPGARYDVKHVTWDEIHKWVNSGNEVGGHSHSHICMTRLSENEIGSEILNNKKCLEKNLHLEIKAFSYPYGEFNKKVKRIVSKNYMIAFSTDEGISPTFRNRYSIKRLVVDPKWDLHNFDEKIEESFK
jgi:peptidoglycan/xylan/chitin deacetylase (PgdA/CDA1 family)